MAGSKSNWLENEVLDHLLGKATTALSTGLHGTIYLGLWRSTAGLTDAHTGASTGECPGSTYARVSITNSSANWANSTGGTKINKAEFQFTTSAGSDWGIAGSFALLSSGGSSGNIFYWGDLTSPQTISAGNVVKFSTGSLTITED